jgi:hypothetical protein
MTELLDLFVQIEQKLAKVYQILQLASQPNHSKENKTADQGKELKSKYRALVPEVTQVSFDELIEQIEDVRQCHYCYLSFPANTIIL